MILDFCFFVIAHCLGDICKNIGFLHHPVHHKFQCKLDKKTYFYLSKWLRLDYECRLKSIRCVKVLRLISRELKTLVYKINKFSQRPDPTIPVDFEMLKSNLKVKNFWSVNFSLRSFLFQGSNKKNIKNLFYVHRSYSHWEWIWSQH